jgi:hypothetical protein
VPYLSEILRSEIRIEAKACCMFCSAPFFGLFFDPEDGSDIFLPTHYMALYSTGWKYL